MKILLLYSRSVHHQQRPNLFQCGPTDLHYIILRLENSKSFKACEKHTYGALSDNISSSLAVPLCAIFRKIEISVDCSTRSFVKHISEIPKVSTLPIKNKPSERNAHTTHLRMRFDQSRRQSSLFFWSAPSTQTLINPKVTLKLDFQPFCEPAFYFLSQ